MRAQVFKSQTRSPVRQMRVVIWRRKNVYLTPSHRHNTLRQVRSFHFPTPMRAPFLSFVGDVGRFGHPLHFELVQCVFNKKENACLVCFEERGAEMVAESTLLQLPISEKTIKKNEKHKSASPPVIIRPGRHGTGYSHRKNSKNKLIMA